MLTVRPNPSFSEETSSLSVLTTSHGRVELMRQDGSPSREAPVSAEMRPPQSFFSFFEARKEQDLDRDAVFAELTPLVKRLCYHYGLDAEMRQDLIGEIYYRLSLLLNAYDPLRGVPLYPYLVRQLTASIHSYARGHRRCRYREIDLETISAGHEALICAPEEDWNHDILLQQRLLRIKNSLNRLPRRQRQVVIWRFFDELSFAEIAQRLGIQEATVRSLLRHGLAKLRQWTLKQGAVKKEARLW